MFLENKTTKVIGTLLVIFFIIFMNYKIRSECIKNGGEIVHTKQGPICLKQNLIIK